MIEQKKYLIVKGCAGIGNRLFTLISAIEYAKETNRIICVDWRDGVFAEPTINAFDLFFKIQGFPVITVKELIEKSTNCSFYPASLKQSIDKSLYQSYRVTNSNFISKIPKIHNLKGRLSMLVQSWSYTLGDNFGKSIHSDIGAIKSFFSKYCVEYGSKLSKKINADIVVFSDYWPKISDTKLFDCLKITNDLQAKINFYKEEIGITEKTIAVHVRYTDKKPTTGVDLLINKLKRVLKESDTVFLATDSFEIETEFKRVFGKQLLIKNKNYPNPNIYKNIHHESLKSGDYTHTQKMYEDSLIDIYLLASCNTFYYQGNSSFSQLVLNISSTIKQSFNWLSLNGL